MEVGSNSSAGTVKGVIIVELYRPIDDGYTRTFTAVKAFSAVFADVAAYIAFTYAAIKTYFATFADVTAYIRCRNYGGA